MSKKGATDSTHTEGLECGLCGSSLYRNRRQAGLGPRAAVCSPPRGPQQDGAPVAHRATCSLTHPWLASSPFLSHLLTPSWGFWKSSPIHDLLLSSRLRMCTGPQPQARIPFRDEETEAPGGQAACAQPTRRGSAAFLNCCGLFRSHWTRLGEDVSVCTGPATSRQVPGIGRTLSSFIHYQGYEASLCCSRDQQSDRAWQFSSGQMGSMFPRALSHPRLDLLWEILGCDFGETREGRGLLQATRPMPAAHRTVLYPGLSELLGDAEKG